VLHCIEHPVSKIWANQPIHLFLVGRLNPCMQGTGVWVGLHQVVSIVASGDFKCFGHDGSRSWCFSSPTGYMLTSFSFSLRIYGGIFSTFF
jgi:hypothetical protein